jgi:hypothetical protein
MLLHDPSLSLLEPVNIVADGEKWKVKSILFRI